MSAQKLSAMRWKNLGREMAFPFLAFVRQVHLMCLFRHSKAGRSRKVEEKDAIGSLTDIGTCECEDFRIGRARRVISCAFLCSSVVAAMLGSRSLGSKLRLE